MSDKIKVPRFRSQDYRGNTPAAKREIFRGLGDDYVNQAWNIVDAAKREGTLRKAAHLLAQAAYAMRQAAAVKRELDHMEDAEK